MAVLKCGKVCVNNVASLQIAGDNTGYYAMCSIVENNECTGTVKVKLPIRKGTFVRFEMNGQVLQTFRAYHPIIFGDVNTAKVGNVGRVEGYIIDYKSSRGNYTVDKNYKCCYGKEAVIRSANKMGLSGLDNKYTIIHLDGNLFVLDINEPIEAVVNGSVYYVEAPNCFDMRGTIKYIEVGNMLYCTLGESQAPSLSKLKNDIKAREKAAEGVTDSLFTGLENLKNDKNSPFADIFGEDFAKGTIFGG